MGSIVRRFLAVLVLASAATYAKGVDVSHWQGPILWPEVVGGSYTFAFGKATEGKTLIDLTFSLNRTGAESVGMLFGAYHFARPGGSGDAGIIANAIAQADFFLDVAQPQAGELPPVLDLESRGGLSTTALQTWTYAWLDQVERRTGVRALVYTSPNFWKTSLADDTNAADAGTPLWIAHWTKNATPLLPARNWADHGWTFWQWTDCSQVPGFAHCVDGDRYRGPDPTAAASPPYPAGVPVPSATPTVVGAAQTGKTLAAVAGEWSGGKPLTFGYQWQRCDAAGGGCTPIVGATAATYLPVADDVGHALVLTVTAQAPGGIGTASSPPTVAIAAAGGLVVRPGATTPPAVSGTPQVGQTLTSSVGTWTGAPTAFTYEWRRCSAAGASCVAIVGATGPAYTLTPDDIGATISLAVTGTGTGGSTSVPAPTTAPVAAAPVPPAVTGSLVAQSGLAGAVVSADGAATVTWQPGAVPAGSTVSLAPSERGLLLDVAPPVPQLPWPVDLAYAVPGAGVVGYSADGRIWRPVPQLQSPELPIGQTAGTYADAGGLLHVLLRTPGRIAQFVPGSWGDPTLVAAGPPTPRVSPLRVTRLANGTVQVVARLSVPSQASVRVNVVAKTPVRRSQLLKPGALPVRLRLRLAHGRAAKLHVVAVDPYGRQASLVLRFLGP